MKTLEDIEIKEKNTIEMNVETSTDETNVMWYKVKKNSFIFHSVSKGFILYLGWRAHPKN